MQVERLAQSAEVGMEVREESREVGPDQRQGRDDGQGDHSGDEGVLYGGHTRTVTPERAQGRNDVVRWRPVHAQPLNAPHHHRRGAHTGPVCYESAQTSTQWQS